MKKLNVPIILLFCVAEGLLFSISGVVGDALLIAGSLSLISSLFSVRKDDELGWFIRVISILFFIGIAGYAGVKGAVLRGLLFGIAGIVLAVRDMVLKE